MVHYWTMPTLLKPVSGPNEPSGPEVFEFEIRRWANRIYPGLMENPTNGKAKPALKSVKSRCDLPPESCPAELSLVELKKEQEARQDFDRQIALTVDDLGDKAQALSLQVEGIKVSSDQLQIQVDELKSTTEKLAPTVAKIANFRWWLAGILAAFEVLRESGIMAAGAKAVELLGGQ